MRFIAVGIFLTLNFIATAQPVRFLHSGSAPDSVFYFLELQKELMQNPTFENQILGGELEDSRIRLALFNEPTFNESSSFILRVCYFSNTQEPSQVIRIYNDQKRVLVTCKTEGDNSVNLSYFRTDKLTKVELRTLTNELKNSDSGLFPEHLQKIVSKAIIEDSLSFKYKEQTYELNENSLERFLSGLSKLNLEFDEQIIAKDIITGNVHDSRPLWILEWNHNGIQKVYLRRGPKEQFENYMKWVLSKCSSAN